jgi:hypothetical protein
VTDIVFVGAVGRSGTTLLERTLATGQGVIALGEMVHMWDRGLRDGEPCGCGLPFRQCPFWTSVGDSAFGGWDALDLAAVARDRRTVDRNRYVPFLIAPRLAPRKFRAAHARLVGVLEALYTGVHDVASRSASEVVLVDSSKHPSYLFLLRAMRRHRIGLLHVVRDPRGVVHSWSRNVPRPESGEAMEQLGTLKGCGRWISHNLLFQLAGLIGVRRRRISYELFTRDPAEIGRALDSLLDRPAPVELDVDGATVHLGLDHTVSGNPMRFQSGDVVVRSDDAWRSAMPRGRRAVVGILTTPLRQVYSR